ncbi:MAG: MGMT family protein [Desulfobacterales bacterium]|nr:MGMT family protein [Desulfobacterales bacterium]
MTYYHICPTAFGYAAILFQKAPLLVKRIFLPHARKSALKRHIQSTCPATSASASEVVALCRDIQAYFEGSPVSPPRRFLDLSRLTPLQRSVLEAVARVPHGQVRTYSQIADQIGRAKAFRFVGAALSLNPFPMLIPCHRIVRSDGSPGEFSGGADLKHRMLTLEGVSVSRGR